MHRQRRRRTWMCTREYREHQYGQRLLKAPLYIHPRATCDTRTDLPQQLKGELQNGRFGEHRERRNRNEREIEWGREGRERERGIKGKRDDDGIARTRLKRAVVVLPVPVYHYTREERLWISLGASLCPTDYFRGRKLRRRVSARDSAMSLRRLFAGVSGFTKLTRFSRTVTKKNDIRGVSKNPRN